MIEVRYGRTILPTDADPWLVALVHQDLRKYMGNPEGDLPWWMVVRNYVSAASQFGGDEQPAEARDHMLTIAPRIWAGTTCDIAGDPELVPDDAAIERQRIAVDKFMAVYEWMVQGTALDSGSDI